MTRPFRPSVLAAAPFLVLLTPAADEVSFRPANGSSAAKVFTLETKLELGDFSLDVNGQDMSGNIELPGDASFGFDVTARIVDHYVKVEGGKPLELVREFRGTEFEWFAADETGSDDEARDLDGKSVVFRWNEETSSYDVAFHEGSEGDAEDLEGLGVDMDFRTLLPGRAVAEGDTWKVEPKGIGTALLLGLDLERLPSFDTEGDEALEIVKAELLPQLEELLDDFEAQCEYTGRRDVDGHDCAVIKLDIACDGTIDLRELILRAAESEIGDEQGVTPNIDDASIAVDLQGEGELLWDLAAGHARAFELEAEIELDFSLDASIDAEGQSFSVSGSAELLGDGKWAMKIGD
jgi:hypothetical protein